MIILSMQTYTTRNSNHDKSTRMSTYSRDVMPTVWRQYEYSPLDHKARSIRLFRILSNDRPTGLLKCEMYHANVDSVYTCLSYVWGPPKLEYWIAVNGKLLRVRRNLLDFLEQCLKRCAKEFFWIDALCIDQQSVFEWNHQVQQM